MHLTPLNALSPVKIFCPFCGAPAFDPASSGLASPCPHQLFAGFLSEKKFAYLKKGFIGEHPDTIDPTLRMKGDDDHPKKVTYRKNTPLAQQIEELQTEDGVCLSVTFPAQSKKRIDRLYIAFAPNAVDTDAIRAAVKSETDGFTKEEAVSYLQDVLVHFLRTDPWNLRIDWDRTDEFEEKTKKLIHETEAADNSTKSLKALVKETEELFNWYNAHYDFPSSLDDFYFRGKLPKFYDDSDFDDGDF